MFAPMKTAACTFALGLSLMGFAVPVEAKKPTPPVTPPASTLTASERLCVSWGALAFEQAHARDRGVSYLSLVALLRQEMHPDLVSTGLVFLRVIYETPTLRPAIIRQQVELACAQRLEGTLVAQ